MKKFRALIGRHKRKVAMLVAAVMLGYGVPAGYVPILSDLLTEIAAAEGGNNGP